MKDKSEPHLQSVCGCVSQSLHNETKKEERFTMKINVNEKLRSSWKNDKPHQIRLIWKL